jgi:hypothetical protein
VGTGIAYGAVQTARYSANTKEYIGCAVMGNITSPQTTYVYCGASDANGKSFGCSTYNPSYVLLQAALAVSQTSNIIFQGNASGQCTYIYAANFSSNL